MHLSKLQLVNYKNFENTSFDFDENINCLVGNNGTGKTNVLDAIYHLSQTKSYFNPVSVQNIKHGKDYFMIEGIFYDGGHENVYLCSYQKGQKKTVKKNGKEYTRFADHIGRIPIVIISPYDRDLITERAEIRRKFINHVISQSDNEYLHASMQYAKVLSQRNALLKYFAKNRTFDPDTLDVYDRQLSDLADAIYRKRKKFVQDIAPVLTLLYKSISGDREEVHIRYRSQLEHAPLYELLKENIEKDKVLQYTGYGIHRDDLEFLMNRDYPIKKFGSQGQQKSYLIALKLAQFKLLENLSGTSPILLLDDIFDKLDDERVGRLIQLVNEHAFGQIFISDTHPGRTEQVVQRSGQSYKIISLA